MCLSIKVREPERVLSEGEHVGFEWVTVGNDYGYRCGYVRVPKGHPWHGKPYEDIGADAHGGLTFGEPDEPCSKGGADDAYWFGFDCAHYGDASDPALPAKHRIDIWGGTIRTQEFVENECRSLCEQAAQAA